MSTPKNTLILLIHEHSTKNFELLLNEVLSHVNVDIFVIHSIEEEKIKMICKNISSSKGRIIYCEFNNSKMINPLIKGIKFFLKMHYDYLITLNTDFSHEPREINRIINMLKEFEIVIGSRYIHGIRVISLKIRELIQSYYANLYIRILSGLKTKDITSSYRGYARRCFESINLYSLGRYPFEINIEILLQLSKKKFRITEIPITYIGVYSNYYQAIKRTIDYKSIILKVLKHSLSIRFTS
jgi:dolichol-phosphate mannosyltransferase